jgi:hypothetical protein
MCESAPNASLHWEPELAGTQKKEKGEPRPALLKLQTKTPAYCISGPFKYQRRPTSATFSEMSCAVTEPPPASGSVFSLLK